MPVDTSFYPTQQPQPLNPLSLVQGYASANNALSENKLLQQTIRGRQALGQIMQKNTDETGIVNPAAALRDISQNPDASWMYLQEQEQFKNANPLTDYMSTNAQGQPTPAKAPLYNIPGAYPKPPQLSQDEIDKLHAHNQAMISTLQPLSEDPNVDHKKIIRGVSDLVAHPDAQFNAMDGATALAGIPYSKDGSPPSSSQIQEKLAPIVAQQKAHEAALSQKYPSSQQLKARQGPVGSTMPSAQAAPANNPLELTTPGIATGVPQGYSTTLPTSRKNYDEVVETAKSAPQMNAAYNEIINLNNAGAPTGTNVSTLYQALAKNVPGIDKTVTDKAVQSQEIGKWLAQGLISNGMPGSDARLYELQHANLNPDQLAGTIKDLAPFFKAVAQGAVKKQEFYNKATNNGSELSKEPEALQQWTSNYDPRWLEYDELSNAKDKRSFLVKHPDLIDKRQSFHNLQQMGVVK